MSAARRRVGETKEAGFQVGARRTFDVAPERAWKLLTSARGTAVWLGPGAPARLAEGGAYELDDGTAGEVRVLSDAHLRLTWQPPGWERPATVQVRVIPRDGRTVVAFHQEHLPGPAERERRKAFYLAALDELASTFESP